MPLVYKSFGGVFLKTRRNDKIFALKTKILVLFRTVFRQVRITIIEQKKQIPFQIVNDLYTLKFSQHKWHSNEGHLVDFENTIKTPVHKFFRVVTSESWSTYLLQWGIIWAKILKSAFHFKIKISNFDFAVIFIVWKP